MTLDLISTRYYASATCRPLQFRRRLAAKQRLQVRLVVLLHSHLRRTLFLCTTGTFCDPETETEPETTIINIIPSTSTIPTPQRSKERTRPVRKPRTLAGLTYFIFTHLACRAAIGFDSAKAFNGDLVVASRENDNWKTERGLWIPSCTSCCKCASPPVTDPPAVGHWKAVCQNLHSSSHCHDRSDSTPGTNEVLSLS